MRQKGWQMRIFGSSFTIAMKQKIGCLLEIISSISANYFFGIDARSGSVLWKYKYSDLKWNQDHTYTPIINCNTPVYKDGKIYIAKGYDHYGAQFTLEYNGSAIELVRIDSVLDVHFGGMILHEGYLYGFSNARLTCMEWATGKKMWSKSISLSADTAPPLQGTGRGEDQYRPPPGQTGFGIASLIQADSRYLCLGETGLIAWLDLSPKTCKILSARRLFNAKQTWTAPVLTQGLLYITQNNPDKNTPPRLLCYDLRKQ